MIDPSPQAASADVVAAQLRERRVLERATRMWRRTVDAIDEPIILIDSDFEVQRSNLAAARLAGEGVKALLGHRCYTALFQRDAPCEGCPLVPPSGPQLSPEGTTRWRGVTPLPRALQADSARAEAGDGEASQRGEIESGRRSWAVSAWRFAEEGEAATAVCHYHETTQERALQRRLLLYTKLAAVGELAGVVAHELNNPLTGILTFSQILGRGGLPPQAIAGLAADIEEAARRCSNIVESLLDYARPAGDAALLAPVELGRLLESCVRLVQIQMAAHDALKIEARWGDLGQIHGNADALKSLVLNLLNNAAQAVKKQGRVSLDGRREGDVITLVVSDDGPGIPPDLRAQIFEPFFTTKAKNKGGTGLGLSIVRNVVDEHGGEVRVDEGPEGGARFTITLPCGGGEEGSG